ncbi:hypothetical protein HDF14_000114 [Edaphobacter lichenicola]|jgi:hypothetical protein|uniref:Uncharacterized protein n=1 Tax=Tunturiibacter gelidiferens TaxID=3069689 RepID=A0A9X0QA66_9BACT|nr:hypothetical protein [Edaphobacter lichenicola]
MLLVSIGHKQLLLWHGRGHRFDPDQVHQLHQQNRQKNAIGLALTPHLRSTLCVTDQSADLKSSSQIP